MNLRRRQRKILKQGNNSQEFSWNVKSGLVEITSPTMYLDENVLPEAGVALLCQWYMSS